MYILWLFFKVWCTLLHSIQLQNYNVDKSFDPKEFVLSENISIFLIAEY